MQVTRWGRCRWGISLTSKWQSTHVFFSWTDPFRLSAVAKRSRIFPSTRIFRNSGFPWQSVHFSSEILASAGNQNPWTRIPRAMKIPAARNILLISPLLL
ncbi:MAG TPA: hypothetical protein DEH27_10360 [Deltaproteobacteria bacterium]|nr:hypothetical protein [Deltaproteobacteria bacterium]